MNRRYSLLLIATATGLLLVACGSDSESSRSGADATTDAEIDLSFDASSQDSGAADAGTDTNSADADETDSASDIAADTDPADTSQADIGGEDGGSDAEADGQVGDDAASDTEVDLPPAAPLYVETPFGAGLTVVLGVGEEGRIETTTEDGGAEFSDPGVGPFTVTVVDSENNRLFTTVDAEGPVVELGAVPSWTHPPTTAGAVAVSGTITGTAQMGNVYVFLLLDGRQVGGSMAVLNEGDNTHAYSIDMNWEFEGPHVARVVAGEAGLPGIVQLGTVLLDEAFSGGTYTDVDFTLDAPVNRTTTVALGSWGELVNPTAQYELLIDGFPFWPTGAGYEAIPEGGVTLNLPQYEGSLTGFEGQLRVYTANHRTWGQRPQNGQLALYPDAGSLPETLMVNHLDFPEMAAGGTGWGDTEDQVAGELNVSFTPATEADETILFIEHEFSCWSDEWSWWLTVPGDATSIETFSLPTSVDYPAIPLGVPLLAAVHSRATDDNGGKLESTDYAWFRLTGGDRCLDAPEWMEGAFEGVSRDSDTECNLGGHSMTVGPCGRVETRFWGGDFIALGCASITEIDEEAGTVVIEPRDRWSSFFEEAEPVTMQEHAAYRGFDAISGVGTSSATSIVWVKIETQAAAVTPDTLPGRFNATIRVEDILADNVGTPGELLVSGDEEVLKTIGFPRYGLTVQDTSSLNAWVSYGLGGSSRAGTIISFTEGEGVVRFTSGNGICSDYRALGNLWQADADTVTLTTTRVEVDVDDLDEDLETDDYVFRRTRFTYVRIVE